MKTLFTLCTILAVQFLQAQEIAGGWYGRGDVMVDGNHSNYLAELNVKQRGNEIEGIMGYYFRNTYQSFYVRGKYNPNTRTVSIRDIPVLYYNSAVSMPGVHCTMNFEAQLAVSRARSTLKGFFLSEAKYRYTCPNIDIRLTRDNDQNTDSLLREYGAMNRLWFPAPEETVVTPALVSEKKVAPTTAPLVRSFEERKPYLIKEIEVNSDSLRVSLYDNGDIDGDTVTVFYNKAPILMKQGLNAQGINIYIQLDATTQVHELSLYAENLGSIPPNTALMIIYDGVNRFEIFSTSNETLNGTVRIKKKVKSKK
jgi:hypothetical protein